MVVFNPQVLFRFEDPSGNVRGDRTKPLSRGFTRAGSSVSPHHLGTLERSRANRNINFRSRNDFKNNRYRITSTNIRLNCPVMRVGDANFPFNDACRS